MKPPTPTPQAVRSYQGIIDAAATKSDARGVKTITKSHSVLGAAGALSLAVLLASHALATPAAEPRRFFDVEKGRFVLNPDYHDPSPAKYAVRRNPAAEPRRIFDLESGNFVRNPDYHEPVATATVARHLAEPRRFFDVFTGRFVLNPDYR